MARQVISPTLGRTSEDFPRLNGSNFAVWNARVRAALDGQGLLGFIDQEDFDGDSDSASSDLDEIEPLPPKPDAPPSPTPSEALLDSDTGTLPPTDSPTEDADGDTTGRQPDPSSSEAPSDSSSGNSSDPKVDTPKPARPTKTASKAQSNLPAIKSFADTKREKDRRRALLRAKAKQARAKLRAAKKRAARKPSSRERRRMERKTRSFLISTIDDAHVLLVEGCTSAYAIYQKLRDRYEGSSAHGDPYYINHYLMTIKYEEGTDLMAFFIELERALKDAAEATGIVMTDEQKSLYLYHAMPSSWKPDLAIWKGSKKFIPYTDLKTNIERKVLDDYAKRKYIIDKGSPESRATSNETALKAVHNAPDGRDDPASPASACTYCQSPNRAIRDCRVLQKHLRTGTVKEGTVLPANFAIIERKPRDDKTPFPAKHPRYQRSGDRQRPSRRPDQGSQPWKAPEIYDRFGNPVNYQELQRKYHSREREAGLIAYTTILMPDIGLSATSSDPHDPTWTVDSGCTRHAAYQESWFKEIRPYAGAIMVGGKQQLPIRGIGDIILEVVDSKGTTRQLEFCDVLFVPDMKFNLLSIAQVLKMGIRLVFSRTRCTFFVGKNYKLHVELAADMDLFQLRAKTPPKTPPTALVSSDSADDNPAKALVAQPGMDPNVLLWHKLLGHPNFRAMQTMSKTQAAPELAFTQASAIPKHFCPSCIFAKAHRAPFNSNVDRSKSPLEKVHSDINGPLPYPSLSGAHYFITFIDDYSRFMHLYVVAHKSDLYDCYEKFRKAAKNRFNTEVSTLETQFNQYDPEVQRLQSDNGKEYEKLGKIIFDRYGTHAQFTNAYTPQQNGVAERRMRTILERVRALLIDGDLPRQLWGECCQYVTHLINVTTSSVLPKGVTPYELWHGKKPSLAHIKVFGCAAFALIPEPHRNKLQARARLCMFVGLPQNKKGYRLLNTTENRIIYSRDVTFKEETFPNLTFLERATPDPLSTSLPVQKELLPSLSALLKRNHASLVATDADVCSSSPKKIKHPDADVVYSKALLLNESIDLEEEQTQRHTIITLLAARYDPEPKTYKEAMGSPHASDWHTAALSEYHSLMHNKTWTLVPRPHSRKVLHCRWVFVRKRDAAGSIVRFKARLVIKGFQQKYGIDYTEIFSPVVRMEVLRLLLTLAAILDYEIEQMDVKTAFLNGSLDVEIFMEQPEGFKSKSHPELVCRLDKSLYGLNQAPRVWYYTFAQYLERLGFRRLIKDRCVFFKVIFNAPCYISVYVDDLLIISPSKQVVARVKSALSSEFHMTDLGGVSYLLGWTIERNRATRSIFIHQKSYATKVLDRFNMLGSYPTSTPIIQKLSASDCPNSEADKANMAAMPYREAVGSFMYLMTGTRPDLAYFLREVSQYLGNPGKSHWKAVKHGLRYLKGTTDFGITLGGVENLELLQSDEYLMAYTDSDYASCQDTRRCIGEYITMFCNSPISWVSRRHHTVVLSTTEAEYIALCYCMQELMYIKLLLRELGYDSSKPTLILEDNQSCIKICNNPELHGRSKHIDIKYFFVQEKVARKEFTINYCNTTKMCADIFTKPLAKPSFEKMRELLRVNRPHPMQ